jgi:hypothetical protein
MEVNINCKWFQDKSALIKVEIPLKNRVGIGYTIFSPLDVWDWNKSITIAQGRAEKALALGKDISPINETGTVNGHRKDMKAYQYLAKSMKVTHKGICKHL